MGNKPKKILIAEDDAFIMEMYSMKLVSEGFEVISANDGERTVDKTRSEKPDLILLDILMPKLDGKGALKKIKSEKETANIPVIVLTNVGEQDSVKEILDLGASDYLIKSNFTPDEVVEKVKKYI